jgi:hypothetical protein
MIIHLFDDGLIPESDSGVIPASEPEIRIPIKPATENEILTDELDPYETADEDFWKD